MKPYYSEGGQCACGCGSAVMSPKRRYISGHNLRGLERTEVHRKRISEAQTRAWQTKRTQKPIGATSITTDGYVRVKVVKGKGRWIEQHVLVMEAALGRKLAPGEIVHHVNGQRTDNRPENLFLCKDHSHHMEIESQLKSVFRQALEAGIVRFNAGAGRYELP